MAVSSKPAFDNFVNFFECPVTLTLLDTAVSLFPCSHKVNDVAAERFFGKMNKQRGVEKNAPCPCCRQMIIAYEPDHTVRSWIPLIKKRSLQAVQLEAEQKEKMDPSYPGKSGKFILDKDLDWIHSFPIGEYVKQLKLNAVSSDSFIKEITIHGLNDGTVRIQIDFDKSAPDATQEYFATHKLRVDWGGRRGSCLSKCHETTRKLFAIIIKHNEIPEQELVFMRRLVKLNNWKFRMPLSLGNSFDPVKDLYETF